MFAQPGVLLDFTSALAASRPHDKADESGGKSMAATSTPAAQADSYRVGDLDFNRIGYGAMRPAGPGVFGPPRDRAAAIEVLRTAVELGVNHIDTADAYGPYITNEIIREALFPYGDHVHIVTKVGVVRDERGGWLPANSPQSLREQVHDGARGNGRATHRVRAVLPARRLLATAVRRAGAGRQALGVTPTAVAQSWLVQHSPNIMLIPGTSSVAHLRENITGAALTLPADAVAELDAI
jgi:aryl-alcohol dehydrogenase-like predicted oxidoreductase